MKMNSQKNNTGIKIEVKTYIVAFLFLPQLLKPKFNEPNNQ